MSKGLSLAAVAVFLSVCVCVYVHIPVSCLHFLLLPSHLLFIQ